MTLREWVHELLRRWRCIVAGICAGLSLGGLVTALTPAQYAADTTLYVSPGVPTTDAQAAYQGGLLSEHRMKSYVELITSERVAEEVRTDLDLPGSAADLADRIAAVAQPETMVLTVTARDGSPARAAETADATAASFGRLVQQLEQTPGEPGPSPVRVQVVQAAEPPTTPVAPVLSTNLVLGGLLGLLVGSGAAGLRRALDDSVRSTSRLHEVTGAPVLGVVPVRAAEGPGRPASGGSSQVETHRRLRTNLHHTGPVLQHGLLAVTSPARGDGRSTLLCDLADVIAAGGSRVLVVDTDLRRPALREHLGVDTEAGLIDLLSGTTRLTEAIRPWRTGSFDLLVSGPVPLNPSEVVGSQQMTDLLGELRQRYDVVLLDSPPLLEVTDGAELAAVADGAVLLCRHGRTTYQEAAEATEVLRTVSARLLGVVVTMASSPRGAFVAARTRGSRDAEPPAVTTPVLADTLRRSRPRPPAPTVSPGPARLTGPRHAEPQSQNHHGSLPER